MNTNIQNHWLNTKEVGTSFGLKILLYLANTFGRKFLRLILHTVVFYYTVFHRQAGNASKQYLSQMGLPHRFRDRYRHLLYFAQCAADRLFLIQGRNELFEFEITGNELLDQLCEQKKGAILLGAHIGSFEAMVAHGPSEQMIVNVVGYFENAKMINNILKQQGKGTHTRMLEIRPNDVSFMLKLRECIDRGEFIAILGDRSVQGQTVEVEFLGRKAQLPSGIYSLAAILRCPVYLTFALYQQPNRYKLYCELFAEEIKLTRKDRQNCAQQYAQKFAKRLEHYCHLAPNNWFNFYDFWNTQK